MTSHLWGGWFVKPDFLSTLNYELRILILELKFWNLNDGFFYIEFWNLKFGV
jgi:hypothetical protein